MTIFSEELFFATSSFELKCQKEKIKLTVNLPPYAVIEIYYRVFYMLYIVTFRRV